VWLVVASDTVVDLMIAFYRELSFHPHIGSTWCKTFKTLDFVKRMYSEFKTVALLI